MIKIYTGNAEVDGKLTREWIVGRFMPDNDIHQSADVEIKWGKHKKGEARTEWVTGEHRTTIAILISGSFSLFFRDVESHLVNMGDYVMWGKKVDHKWIANEDSIVLTVRWPSISVEK